MGYVGKGSNTQVLTDHTAAVLPSFTAGGGGVNAQSFMVYVATAIPNVTGDATVYTVLFDTVSFDNGSNITLNSGGHTIFTAPVTGYYLFNCYIRFTGLNASAYDNFQINIVNTTQNVFYENPQGNISGMKSGNDFTYGGGESIIVQCNASDVLDIQVGVHFTGGGSKSVGVGGIGSGIALTSWWSGMRVG